MWICLRMTIFGAFDVLCLGSWWTMACTVIYIHTWSPQWCIVVGKCQFGFGVILNVSHPFGRRKICFTQITTQCGYIFRQWTWLQRIINTSSVESIDWKFMWSQFRCIKLHWKRETKRREFNYCECIKQRCQWELCACDPWHCVLIHWNRQIDCIWPHLDVFPFFWYAVRGLRMTLDMSHPIGWNGKCFTTQFTT